MRRTGISDQGLTRIACYLSANKQLLGVVNVYDDDSIEIVDGLIPSGMSTSPMGVDIDERVMRVAAFMQRTLDANDLQGVAKALATIAPTIWGQFDRNYVWPMRLKEIE